jgi:hypothetical protein
MAYCLQPCWHGLVHPRLIELDGFFLDGMRDLIDFGEGAQRGCVDKKGRDECDQFDRETLLRLLNSKSALNNAYR